MNYQQEHIKPYDQAGSKGQQVEQMFNSIAHSYDFLNHALSFGIDHYWRRTAMRTLRPHNPQHLLDIATGTGDFALLAARMLHPQSILGIDLSKQMMEVAQTKVEQQHLQHIINFQQADCMHLNLPSNQFDAITAAFGIRNFEHLDQGLAEMQRVLRPGGHLVIIELTEPQRFPMKHLFHLYAHHLMPLLGRIISHDSRAYTYLPATIEAFPQGERMELVLHQAGFTDVHFRRLTFGICTLYTASKPIDSNVGKEPQKHIAQSTMSSTEAHRHCPV